MKKTDLLLKKIATYEKTRNTVDYEMAASLHELRAILKTDMDFLTTVAHYFEIHGKTLNMWLRTAKFYKKFSKRDWQQLGGREGVQKMAYLTTPQRKRVITEARLRASTRKRPLSAATIQNIITGYGYRTKTPGQGRSRQTVVERRLMLTQNWLNILYSQYTNLPKRPTDVMAACKRSKLAKTIDQMRKSG